MADIPKPPRPRAIRALAAIVLVAAVLWGGCPGPKDPGSDDGGRPAPPTPLVVVGIDGATWEVIDPMIDRGELPNIAALRENGAVSDLLVLPPLSSPAVWTTYMTGHFPRRHGILDHTFPYAPGPKRRVTSTLRREPTLWNLASRFGRRSGIFGYYATHPVEHIDGVMVSDRADQMDTGGVYPQALEPRVRDVINRLAEPEALRNLRALYFPEPYSPKTASQSDSPFAGVLQSVRRLDRGLRHEAFVTETALGALADSFAPDGERFDLFVVYLRMTDITCHTTWLYFDDSAFEEKSTPEMRDLLGDCLPESYRQADAFLGRLVETLDAGYGPNGYNLVALSDHGCGPAIGRYAIGRKGLSHLSGNHYANGIVLTRGPDLARGRLPRTNHMDIMPTLLALAGLPISDELPGRIHDPLLRPGLLEERRVRRAPAYRLTWQTAGGVDGDGDAAESEELAALEALGYVDGGTAVAAGVDGDGDFD
ncbi:MAG: alkaline phosphatase family protein, partial [Acidobacteriota bacterium]